MNIHAHLVDSRVLVFEHITPEGGKEEVKVNIGENERVISAEGVQSVTRKIIAKVSGSQEKSTPWRCKFRVLFSPRGKFFQSQLVEGFTT